MRRYFEERAREEAEAKAARDADYVRIQQQLNETAARLASFMERDRVAQCAQERAQQELQEARNFIKGESNAQRNAAMQLREAEENAAMRLREVRLEHSEDVAKIKDEAEKRHASKIDAMRQEACDEISALRARQQEQQQQMQQQQQQLQQEQHRQQPHHVQPCPHCPEKELRIRALQARVSELETAVSN